MSIKKHYQRQTADHFALDLGIADIGSTNATEVKLPFGAVLISLVVDTITAFDGTGIVTATVTDGTTVYANAVDVKTTGSETVSNVPMLYDSGGKLTISINDVNANSTVGRIVAYGSYIVLGECDSIYGESAITD